MPIAGCIVDIDNIAPGAIGKTIGGAIGAIGGAGGAIGGTISVELELLTGHGEYNGYTGRETI
jgi:hypothetical protein